MRNGLNEVLDLVRDAQRNPTKAPEDIARSWSQPSSATTGLNYYDLEAPAKKVYPVITPLRNMIARVGGGRGTAVNWKAITAINTTGVQGGVSDGNRGAVISETIVDKLAAFRGIGFENFATFEADFSAEGFDDARARAVESLLRSTMIFEELCDLGGNTTIGLGTTPTPTTALVSGGALTAQATNVICIALTLQGWINSSVSLAGVPVGPISRTNADGSIDLIGSGAARKSAASAQTTASTNLSISAVVTPVRGAVAYAWYWGASGSEKLGAITTINSVLATADATTTQAASAHPASDQSINALVYDGMIPQIFGGASVTYSTVQTVGSTMTINQSGGTNGSGSLIGIMANGTLGTGTPLTADGKGGIVEFDALMRSMWDVYRLSPDTIWVSAQEINNITAKVLTGNSNPAFRFSVTADQGGLRGGFMVSSYLNKFSPGGPKDIAIKIHPNMPPGTVLFWSDAVPYPTSNIGSPVQKKLRRDYYQLEWPLRSRKYEYGVYFDGVLQVYFPPAFAIITNIGNG